MNQNLNKLRVPIVPERIRRIGSEGFSFIPHRFLRDGFLTSLQSDELALYVFLVLAGNKDGVSFYRYDAICSALRITLEGYLGARNTLIDRDLVAFDGTRFQVLSLPTTPEARPPRPLVTEADFARADPATIRASVLDALHND